MCFYGLATTPGGCLSVTLRQPGDGRVLATASAAAAPAGPAPDLFTGPRPVFRVCVAQDPGPGPFRVEVQSGEHRSELRDVVQGDVFLCSGQSNMELGPGWDRLFADRFRGHPQVRMLHIDFDRHEPDRNPRASARLWNKGNAAQSWRPMAPADIAHHSAVCSAFGQELAARLRLPSGQVRALGLVLAAYGSTPLQAFLPATVAKRAMAECPASTTPKFWDRTSHIWNAALAPLALARTCLAAVLWYQGEDNSHSVGDAEAYACHLRLFFEGLRSHFCTPSTHPLQIHYVELASRNTTTGRHTRSHPARVGPSCLGGGGGSLTRGFQGAEGSTSSPPYWVPPLPC